MERAASDERKPSPGLPEPLTLDHLVISQLRNIERAELQPAARLNVITGNNGQGKTSVLEAIYLLATSRSFRTPRLAEMVRHGSEIGSVRGRFVEHGSSGAVPREQSAGVQGSRRHIRIDGQPPSSLAHYATRSPVVVFDPQQMSLSTGPASERRTMLDRICLFSHPQLAVHRSRYGRALRERQKLLTNHGVRQERAAELDAYEVLLAEHGAHITAARAETVVGFAEKVRGSFNRIGSPELVLDMSYQPAGSAERETALEELKRGRSGDAQRKRTGFGPHRDELLIGLDGHPARVVASQGQHRAVTLALKAAELASIAEARGVQPVLLLDDVSSELDAERTSALLQFLASTESQIFLTTTRRDLIVRGETEAAVLSGSASAAVEVRRDFVIEQGVLRPA